MNRRPLLRAAALVALAAGFALPALAQTKEKVTLLLNWYVYSEHAPFFLGKDKGFYDAEGIDLARSMGANPFKVFLKFRLPTALPSIFSGLKVSVTLAVVGAVVGEFVGSNAGIGYVLQKANGTFDLPLMFAALVILSMVGVLLFLAVELVERWLLPWHASQRLDAQAGA